MNPFRRAFCPPEFFKKKERCSEVCKKRDGKTKKRQGAQKRHKAKKGAPIQKLADIQNLLLCRIIKAAKAQRKHSAENQEKAI